MFPDDVVADRTALERELRQWRNQHDTFVQALTRSRITVAELSDLIGGIELDRLPEEDQ